MKTRGALAVIGSVALAMIVAGCGRGPSGDAGITQTVCDPAPPGPADLGPATGLATPPPGAVVFDLKYLPQRGTDEDISYRSFWGYGGATEETKTDPFLTAVRQKAAGKLHYEQNLTFKGRKWAAVEYKGQKALAMYFDADANGELGEKERLLPVRAEGNETEFITPDFVNVREDGKKVFCRALLRVDFYEGSNEPNCMWSPAALLEGTAQFDGQEARLLLFANGPGGAFDQYGSCNYALLQGQDTSLDRNEYVPREQLSTLIAHRGKFYHLSVEGSRTNGLPARVVLVKDTTPTGELGVKLDGAESLKVTGASVYLQGTEETTVFFHCSAQMGAWQVPAGTYALTSGTVNYGKPNAEWELWFRNGPSACVKETTPITVSLGKPTLKVRALPENERYNSNPKERTTFKKGTKIYLEPRIIGNGQELFTRFRQKTSQPNDREDRPPQVTITGPGGKQVLSSTMEYG